MYKRQPIGWLMCRWANCLEKHGPTPLASPLYPPSLQTCIRIRYRTLFLLNVLQPKLQFKIFLSCFMAIWSEQKTGLIKFLIIIGGRVIPCSKVTIDLQFGISGKIVKKFSTICWMGRGSFWSEIGWSVYWLLVGDFYASHRASNLCIWPDKKLQLGEMCTVLIKRQLLSTWTFCKWPYYFIPPTNPCFTTVKTSPTNWTAPK